MCTIDNMAATCVTNLAPILDLKTADSTICRTGRSPLKCTIRCTLVQLISTHVVSFMSVLFRYRQTRRPHHDLNTSLPISSRHSPPVPVLCLSLYIPYLAGNRPAPWRANPSAASWCLPSLTPTILLLSPPAVFILNTCIVIIIMNAVVSETKTNAT